MRLIQRMLCWSIWMEKLINWKPTIIKINRIDVHDFNMCISFMSVQWKQLPYLMFWVMEEMCKANIWNKNYTWNVSFVCNLFLYAGRDFFLKILMNFEIIRLVCSVYSVMHKGIRINVQITLLCTHIMIYELLVLYGSFVWFPPLTHSLNFVNTDVCIISTVGILNI